VRDLRWAVAGLIVGTTLLSGCSEKVEANDTLPTTSAAETTEALPPVGPADFPVPDEARTKDAAGARAFLDYWVALLNRQQAIPAGQPLRDLGPDCHECLRIAQNYDEAAAAGNKYVGGELSVHGLATPLLENGQAVLSFGVRREPASLVNSDGAVLEARPDPAPDLISGITLAWSTADQSWSVIAFTVG
jgi:hypothetical protein